jgi:hypothetical protein
MGTKEYPITTFPQYKYDKNILHKDMRRYRSQQSGLNNAL